MVADGTPCNGGTNICFSGQCVARPPAGTSSATLTSTINVIIPVPVIPSGNFSSKASVTDDGAHSAVGDGWQLTLVIIPSVIVTFIIFGLIVKCSARVAASKRWALVVAKEKEEEKSQSAASASSSHVNDNAHNHSDVALPMVNP